jgi:adenylate cyclase
VEHEDRVWEIDVFEDANAGLVLAEVELNAADETIDVPDWAGPEVSEDERYYNAYLARYPFETWGASTV